MKKERVINGQVIALEEFIQENSKMVYKICHEYRKAGFMLGLEYEDLVQVGTIGLINTFQNYRADRNTQLSTFMYHNINWVLMEELNIQNPTLKFSRTAKTLARKILANSQEHFKPVELVQIYDVSLEAINEALSCLISRFSLSLGNYETLNHSNSNMFNTNTIKTQDINLEIEDFKKYLSEVEVKVFSLRLQEKRQQEISESLNISQSKVSRISAEIRKKFLVYVKDSSSLEESHLMSDAYNQPRIIENEEDSMRKIN